MTRIASLSLLVASLALAPRAFAQAGAESEGPPPAGASAASESEPAGSSTTGSSTVGSSPTGTSTTGSTRLSDDQALLEERETAEETDNGFDPHEHEGRDYFFLGALVRGQLIPSYPFEVGGVAFPNGFDMPINGAFGAYFNYRKNGFNIQFEVFYQGFGWEGFLRGETDAATETEFIDSQLGVVFGWFGFSWSIPLASWFAIEIGVGLGVGGTIGDLYRQEAWESGGRWEPCNGQSDPDATYCDADLERPNPSTGRLDDSRIRGGTYQIRNSAGQATGANPFYFGEGGVPPIFATIDLPRVSFRIKPLHQLQIRIDTAFNLYGVSLGASAGFGF